MASINSNLPVITNPQSEQKLVETSPVVQSRLARIGEIAKKTFIFVLKATVVIVSGAIVGVIAYYVISEVISRKKTAETAAKAAEQARLASIVKPSEQKPVEVEEEIVTPEVVIKKPEILPPEFVEAKYKQRVEDPDHIPASDHAKRYKGIGSMEELTETAVDLAAKDLLTLGNQNIHYHITKSQDIAYSENFEGHRRAILSYAILDLMDGAELKDTFLEEGDCHGGKRVVFNDEELFIENSNPVKVDLNGQPVVFFQKPSWWTMKPDERDCPNGIEPVGLKFILNRLTVEQKNHLRNLILDPFMSLDDMLRAAYAYRDSNDEGGKLVAQAYDMIHTMSCALMQKHKSKLLSKLSETFDDDTIAGYVRPENPQEAIKEAENLKKEVFVEWTPNMNLVKGAPLTTAVLNLRGDLTTIAANLSLNIVDRRQNPGILDGQYLGNWKSQLGPRFYHKHNYNNHGCSIDSIATLIWGKNPDYAEGKAVKGLIADYLDTPDGKKKFEDRIKKEIGKTVSNYQKWLRGDTNPAEVQESLQIELVANALGLRIGMFVDGLKVTIDDNGLPVPQIEFGPKTKEILYIYSDAKYSFYPLEPKLRIPKGASKQLANAINRRHQAMTGMDDEQRCMRDYGF